MSIPPATGSTTPQSAPLPPGTTGTIVQLPPTLPPLQAGDILEGVVTTRLPNSSVTVETPSGSLTLRINQPIALNTAVLLRVTLAGGQPTVSVARKLPDIPATLPTAAGTTTGTAPNIITATVTRSLATAPATSAAVPDNTPGQPPTGTASTALSTLPAGTKLPIRIVSVTPVQSLNTATVKGSSAAPPTTVSSATSTATPTATAAPASATSSSDSGATVRPSATGPAGTSQQIAAAKGTAGSPPGPSAPIPATVKGTNIFGQPVIQADSLELTLPAGRPLPTGGTLQIERAGAPIFPLASGTASQTLAVAQRWEALNEALHHHASPAIRTAIAQAIPQANAQLAGTLLFFMAALRGGDARNWLGVETARLLEGDRFFGRIADEFGIMQRLATEPSGQDWRMFLIPFLSDSQLQQMRLFVRGQADECDGSRDAAGIRFVIEASFSRLGPFQFDGLVQPRNMNLVVRTEQALADTIRRDISEIYTTSLQALGFSGIIDFRAERFFEVKPLLESGLAKNSGVTA